MNKEPKPPRVAEAVRKLGTPSSHDRQRVRAGIERALASGEVSDTVRRVDDAILSGAPLTRAAWWTGKASLAKLLLPTLLVGIGIGTFVGRQTAPPASGAGGAAAPLPNTAGLDVTPLQVEPSSVPDPRELASPEAPFDVSAPAPAPAPAPAHRLHHAHRSSASEHAPPPEEVPAIVESPLPLEAEVPPPPQPLAASHHLAEELRLMRVASGAMNQADWAGVDRALAEHQARFPHGALSQERRALRLLSQCKRGRRPAASELAAFLRDAAHSTLALRVREACEVPR